MTIEWGTCGHPMRDNFCRICDLILEAQSEERSRARRRLRIFGVTKGDDLNEEQREAVNGFDKTQDAAGVPTCGNKPTNHYPRDLIQCAPLILCDSFPDRGRADKTNYGYHGFRQRFRSARCLHSHYLEGNIIGGRGDYSYGEGRDEEKEEIDP